MEKIRKALSIIVFNDNSEACISTLRDIIQQSLFQKEEVEVILVECDEKEKNDVLMENIGEVGQHFSILKMSEKEQAQILEKAVSQAAGEYIHITKAGVGYKNPHMLDKVCRAMKKKRAQTGLVEINIVGKTLEIRELNAYTKELGKKTNLDTNFRLIHCNYFAYFLKRDTWSDQKTDNEIWTLAVMKKLFCTVVSDKNIYKIPHQEVTISDPNIATCYWRSMLREQHFEEFWKTFLKPILEFCKQQKNICRKNAEYNLLYYCKKMQDMLLGEEAEKTQDFHTHVDEVMDYIENDEILIINQYFSRAYKCFLLNRYSWKENEKEGLIEKRADILSEEFAQNDALMMQLSENKFVYEGRTALYTGEAFDIFMLVDGEKIPCEISQKENYLMWFGEKISHIEYYRCEIPLREKKVYQIQTMCIQKEREVVKHSITYGEFFPLSNRVPLFVRRNGWIFGGEKEKGVICLAPDCFGLRLKKRIKRFTGLLISDNASRKALIVRFVYGFLNHFKKKQVWLVSDRTNRGDDNGECFFRYLNENPQPYVKTYYVIEKKCKDYVRMQKYGEVVDVFSWRHKFLHLLCDYLVSSQANKPVINPFGAVGQYYKDIIAEKPLVFLQHGVIKDDLSGWLNRYNRNLYGFVTTTRAEYQSILDYDYYYTPKEVWLTGLPRHDYLENDEKKYITIMPTWRKTLTGGTNAAGEWNVGADFVQSSFFKFYDGILNDERLLRAAKKYGYTICFFPHPNVKPAMPLFHQHKDVIFWDIDKPYREVYAQSNLILTDYSSAVFDFAYLRKPIIYCQFDRKEFFSGGHSYVEGYYNYQTDGFGEIEENLEGTVDRLIEYMENGCQLKPEYRRRIDETFAFHDKKCCERVLAKIRDRS